MGPEARPDAGPDAGAHEVLRDRMAAAAADLAARARALDDRRTEAFGGAGLELAGAARLDTGRPRVPCDAVAVGGALLLGANPPAGHGRPESVADVLTLHRLCAEGGGPPAFEPTGPEAVPGLLDDPRLHRDVEELFRYYRHARLLRLRRTGPLLLAVFSIGERATDIRVLRWRAEEGGTVAYLDDKGERDHLDRAPRSAQDVVWTPAAREDHVTGRHPHVAVDGGTLYVSTVGGFLTVKTGNDTETAEGVHSEPVEDPLQALADAEIAHARVGPLVLLRVLPYNEAAHRHLVFNTRTGEVLRLDGIGQACRRLPDDQGVVFPGGCYLADAPAGSAARTFEADTEGMEFEAEVRSPGGEDVLYVFHAPARGRSLLLSYNLIGKEAAAPIPALGHALFDDGTLAVLGRAPGGEETAAHPVRLWNTPYTLHPRAAGPAGDGPLARVGNAELVRGISDCLSVVRLAEGVTGWTARGTGGGLPTAAALEAVTAACARAADRHHWLDAPGLAGELEGLGEPLRTLREAAGQAVAEYARVAELRERAAAAVEETAARTTALVRRARGEVPGEAAGWVDLLAGLRRARGAVETLRELRHADTGRIDALGAELDEALAATGRRAAADLSRADAFEGVGAAVAELAGRAAFAATAAEAEELGERIAGHADGLGAVTEVIGSLEVGDATVRTAVLERIGEATAAVNRARAVLEGRRRKLLEAEGRAEFAAETALLGQAVTGALAAAGTPDECDEQLGRLLVRLEDLESRFGAHEDFLARLAERREEIRETFAARRQAQADERARRAERLAVSAARVLETVARRCAFLASAEEVAAHFAADPLVARIRAAVEELRSLGDTARAEELTASLAAARQEADRALRDRVELGADAGGGAGTVRLGRHRFAVSTRPLEVTLVPHGDGLAFAVSGTGYRAAVRDPDFAATREFWDQPLVSESPHVYRAEHLAAGVLADLPPDEAASGADAGEADAGSLLPLVRRAAETAYEEGYDRGVHDHDAAAILAAALRLRAGAGLLRFTPEVRAAAQLFWAYGADGAARAAWTVRAQSLARARAAFGAHGAPAPLAAELSGAVKEFLERSGLPVPPRPAAVGAYLAEELAFSGGRFAVGPAARALLDGFHASLGGAQSAPAKEFAEDLRALGGSSPDDPGSPAARHQLAAAWLGAYAESAAREGGEDGPGAGPSPDLPEAVAVALCGEELEHRDVDAPLTTVVTGLLGTHPRIAGGALPLRLDEFLDRTGGFRAVRVPAHRAYTRRRAGLLDAERERLRLEAYVPRVLPAFVRNRLIDEVYLPLIGDNLAKQLGTAGEDRRTDSQGLLLLLSPPGYGKTTLMEYVAARLGLAFVRVDGPALGHRTTSLDPAAAPDATARREVEKINFALEAGSDVLLHLDDVQHTSPELLQRFIPLCDAQRRLDGVRFSDGRPATYDLRGKRFAVCMTGNPFTESGARFRVPDMLANRADVWNLGDVLSGREELFAFSHIENSLTANPVLAPLASRERADTELLVRLADGDPSARPDRLSHPYAPAELEQVLGALRGLLRVRAAVLAVNAAYIASASGDETARTEPPFRLQGSYRDTGKLAGRLAPVMTEEEVEALIDDHYTAEARTLSADAEANLLKLAELRGRMTGEQERRWREVKEAFRARNAPGASGASGASGAEAAPETAGGAAL
ncbi:DNA repair ATPase [Streptomyces verrucosisporus]|uniref:DNA repair ATPase n=1 Tax=Streptomyces verrucosisporus TaxID=1695161 RepID=UPI0019D2368A|nr:DNA repair ATPase [Streptomyces verrucosisporus]MBN3932589.1 DNA repair ATPase [Streptomyces verrucosisporus]